MTSPRSAGLLWSNGNHRIKIIALFAAIIARFAAVMRPRPTEPISANQQQLRDWTLYRSQLTKLIVQCKNQIEAAHDRFVKRNMQSTLRHLQKQLQTLEAKINTLLEEDERFHKAARIIASVPGLGTTSAAMLISELPELGHLNRKQIARLIGVAPTNRDSGTMRGKRTTGGGRQQIRQALFMPLLSAIRCNARIREFYQRLLQNGKPKMVALIACMRKLITILNVMIKEQTTWNQNTNIA